MRHATSILQLAVLAALAGCTQVVYRGSAGSGYARGGPDSYAPVPSYRPWPQAPGPAAGAQVPAAVGAVAPSWQSQRAPDEAGIVTTRIVGPDEAEAVGAGGTGGVAGDVSAEDVSLPWTPGPAMVLPEDAPLPVVYPSYDAAPVYEPVVVVPPPQVIGEPEYIPYPVYEPIYGPQFFGGAAWGNGDHDWDDRGGRVGPGGAGRGGAGGGGMRGGPGSGATGRGSGDSGRAGGGTSGAGGRPPVAQLPGTPRSPILVAPVTAIPPAHGTGTVAAPVFPAPLVRPDERPAPPLIMPTGGGPQHAAGGVISVPTIKPADRPMVAPAAHAAAASATPAVHAAASGGASRGSGGSSGGPRGNRKNPLGP